MRSSIRSRLLAVFIVLILVTLTGISATYYVLLKQDKQREFRQRIRIAFDIILNDFEARSTNAIARTADFLLGDTLAVATSRYAEDEERLGSISFVSTNLAKTADELKRFGHITAAQSVMVYGVNKRLLAAYFHHGDQESTGIYAAQGEKDIYLPADDPAQLTSMLLGRKAIPEVSLPEDIPVLYEGEIPETISAELQAYHHQLGQKIAAPIVYQEHITGILLIDFRYTQQIAQQYASLTQTDVNLFAGDTFSVGTLQEQTTLALETLSPCDNLAVLELLPVTFVVNEYYQGRCALHTMKGQPVGAITISLSKDVETQAVKTVFFAVLSISGIIFTITLGISWIFSRKISRPITTIATLIHQISDGDITGVFDESPVDHSALPDEKAVPVANRHVYNLLSKPDEHRDEISLLTHSFYAMAEYLKGMAVIANKISRGDIAQHIRLHSERDALGIAFQRMLEYIQTITDLARTISDGDLLVDVQPQSEQDILSHALRKMINYVQGVANVAEAVSEGDLNVRVQPRAEQDVLNQALKKMVAYIQEVADVTERVANNELQVDVLPKSDGDILNISLQHMVANLQMTKEHAEQSMAEVERQNWLKTGQAELSNVMRGEQDSALLAKHIITYLAQYLQAQIGLLYLKKDHAGTPRLQLTGSYAYSNRQGNRNKFAFGEGLVGQAALEQETLLFSNVPESGIVITSGLGEIAPRNILVIPFSYEGEVKGVIELGTMYAFTEYHKEFLEQACENIAIAIHTAQSRLKMQQLLEETRRQSDALQTQQQKLRQSNTELEARTQALQASEAKLQAQQEELRNSNVQLTAQTEALKASEEKLQIQQEKLRQTNEELEAQTKALEKQQHVLQEKNAALEKSRQIIEDKARELELSNKYKSEFLANMSHELRTPLNSIVILSKLLHENPEGNLTEKQAKSAQMIYKAAASWAELIEDILEISELERDNITLEMMEMNFTDLTTFLDRNFRERIEEKGLSFTLEIAPDLPASLYTDPKRVEQIMKNLLSNAIKFTEHGAITIHIGRPSPDADVSLNECIPEQTVAIAISDTGIGISKEKQHIIFEAFQQIDGGTSRKHGGTGLGLSISQQLARVLGGVIHVQSDKGQGSTFILYLPEQSSPKEQGTPPIDRQETGYSSPTGHLPEDTAKILVVEDDAMMRQSLAEMLSDGEIAVITAVTGKEAYTHLQTESVCCIILDLGLEDISGFTWLEQLKEQAVFSSIPVIVYTGKTLSRAEEARLNAYAEGIIIKGAKSEERLRDEVRLLLRSRTACSQMAQTPESSLTAEPETILHGKKILVVDDDVRNLYALTNSLEEHGIEVVMGTNGKAALELLETHSDFDAILIDMMIPERDGYEVMQMIRTQPAFRQVPILAFTAKAMKGDREKCLEAGANWYLSKPVNVEKLLSLLRECLAKQKTT